MGGAKGKRGRFGINGKLVGLLVPLVAAVLAVILLLIYANTSRILMAKSEALLQKNTESVVNSVSGWIDQAVSALDAERDALSFFASDEAAALSYIKHMAGQHEAFPSGLYLATTGGTLLHASFVPGPDYDVNEKDWYREGLKSDALILGDVYLDADTQSNVVSIFGAWKGLSGEVLGAVSADLYLDTISQIVAPVQLEQTGGIFLVDAGTNIIIGHRDVDFVGASLDGQGAMYQFISSEIAKGATGLTSYGTGGEAVNLDIAKVPNSNWLAVAYVPRAEVMSDLNALTTMLCILAVAALLVLLVLILFLLRKVVIKPLRELDLVARHIASGRLDQTIQIKSRDEFGTLAENFNRTVSRLRDYVNYIDEISGVLEEIGAGNLVFALNYDYAGEFAKLKTALEHISASLNHTMGEISRGAEQVSGGSEHLASSAQALSQGASQQAAAVEELSASIEEVSAQIRKNAGDAAEAKLQVNRVGETMEDSNRQMQDMIAAMARISESASEIGKIIKTIEDIAFQTNILALNAAVEAARAGQAGKGFAVVADEVRSLANKSQEASKNTAALIERSIRAVEEGTRIADHTARSLQQAVEGAGDVVKTVDRITDASAQQATSIEQITSGIDQISSVVQTNSATAEESAAASEQLSSQAQMMKELVGRFRLREASDAAEDAV